MAKNKIATAKLLLAKNKTIAALEKENADLRASWMEELTARAKDSRELELAYVRGIKLKGVIEYLEDKLKNE